MADEAMELNDSTETFQKGDRVIVSVLGRRRHGHVVAFGSQSCAIHFDSGNGLAKFQTVLVSPSRIKREQPNNEAHIPLSCTIQNRATVMNGALVHGSALHDGCTSTIYNAAAMNGIMHLIRWVTATASYRNTKSNESDHQISTYSNLSLEQIQQLSSDDCHVLNEIAIQNWERRIETNDDGDTKTNNSPQIRGGSSNGGGGGVHDSLVQYFENESITSGFIWEAMTDVHAIRSWQRCIQCDVWFVGKDDTGTYVVPDCRSHEHVVYKVVGFGGRPMASSPSTSNPAVSNNGSTNRAPVRLIRIPMCLRITILPWYGRLLHDTSIPLPRQKESIRMATDHAVVNRLHTVVLHAVQDSTVIEHFAELETM